MEVLRWGALLQGARYVGGRESWALPLPAPTTAATLPIAGFQPASTVSRFAFLGAVDLIVPKPPAVAGTDRYSDSASTAVSALARALAQDAMVGVARLVYQKNAAP